MEFEGLIKSHVQRIKTLKNDILTEEATKTSLIMPFFRILGYDVFNPNEFMPEFVADVGLKKGEKVDYAIKFDNEPVILVECKSINEKLEKHDSQLYRYFGTTTAKFAILTNGIVYRFYTDIDELNKMDEAPFLEINLLELRDEQIVKLQYFTKENFDKDAIYDSAEGLKNEAQIRQIIKEEIENPSEELVKFILGKGVYSRAKTQSVIDKYTPIVKNAFDYIIKELLNKKIETAFANTETTSSSLPVDNEESHVEEESESKIVTTEEELDSYYTVKAILSKHINVDRITYKDKETYFAIILDDHITKWLCRIYIKKSKKYIEIVENGERIKYLIESINDIYDYSDKLVQRLQAILDTK
ncbi:MAG: type I restriction endonuclease [Veillonella parvula]